MDVTLAGFGRADSLWFEIGLAAKIFDPFQWDGLLRLSRSVIYAVLLTLACAKTLGKQ